MNKILIHKIPLYKQRIETIVHNRPTQRPDPSSLGRLAQLVKHCTGIAEVRVPMPVQAFLATT